MSILESTRKMTTNEKMCYDMGYAQGKQDAVPVVRGEWRTWEEQFPDRTTRKKNNLGVFCSACQLHADNMTSYCPNCGAKMESEVLEHEKRLVVLPCKVGDTVYWADADGDEVLELPLMGYWVTVFSDGEKKIDGCVQAFGRNWSKPFGTCLFLTREEAEAALKGAEHD